MLRNNFFLELTGSVESQIYIYFYLGCVMFSKVIGKGNIWVVIFIFRFFFGYDLVYLKDFYKYIIFNFVLNQGQFEDVGKIKNFCVRDLLRLVDIFL